MPLNLKKAVPKVPISVQLAIFHLILTKFCVYILTKNVLGLLMIYLLTTNFWVLSVFQYFTVSII